MISNPLILIAIRNTKLLFSATIAKIMQHRINVDIYKKHKW